MAKWSHAQISVMARAAGWGARSDDVATVAMAESSGDASSVNSIGCVGLLQINQPVHVHSHPKWTVRWLQDPINNLSAGLVLYKAAGNSFEADWADSKNKGGNGGWGGKISGSSGGTRDGGATQTADDPCAWAKGGPAYEYCKKGQEGGDGTIPEDPNAPLATSPWEVAAQIGRLAQAFAKAANWTANPQNWVRIGYVAGGGLLALTAVSVIIRPYGAAAYRDVRAAVPVRTVKRYTAYRRRNRAESENT